MERILVQYASEHPSAWIRCLGGGSDFRATKVAGPSDSTENPDGSTGNGRGSAPKSKGFGRLPEGTPTLLGATRQGPISQGLGGKRRPAPTAEQAGRGPAQDAERAL